MPSTTPETPVIVWGASARAASWSVIRANCQAVAFDLFADLDFPQSVPVTRIESLTPARLKELNLSENSPLLLCGGTEHRLAELEALKDDFHFWTSPPAAIRHARNPAFVSQIVNRHQLPVLPIRSGELQEPIPPGSCWIRKPLQSMGGIGIQKLKSGEDPPPSAEHYDQQFQPGSVCSAQYLSWPDTGKTRLAGITGQIVGSSCLPDRPFAYAGNYYPLNLPASDHQPISTQLQRLGEVLGEACQLRGLWGLDFVLQEETVYPLEINPRYTAAMELIELAEKRSLLAEWLNPDQTVPKNSSIFLKKQILYASKAFRFPGDWQWSGIAGTQFSQADNWQIPRYSDLPAAGTDFRPGEPVCTIWGTGADADECERAYAQNVQDLTAQLARWTSMESLLPSPQPD